jgi:hypothetical protein
VSDELFERVDHCIRDISTLSTNFYAYYDKCIEQRDRYDAEKGVHHCEAKVSKMPDVAFRRHIADNVGELRSVLNALMVHVAKRAGHEDRVPDFPIRKDKKEFQKESKKFEKIFAEADYSKLCSLEPLATGTLVELAALDNARKHEGLTVAVQMAKGLTIGGGSGNFDFYHQVIPSPRLSTEWQEVMIWKGWSTGSHSVNFATFFEKPDVVAGKPVHMMMAHYASVVREIVSQFG